MDPPEMHEPNPLYGGSKRHPGGVIAMDARPGSAKWQVTIELASEPDEELTFFHTCDHL